MVSINMFMGVNPDNFQRRVTIGVLMSVFGIIMILLVFWQSLNAFGQTIIASRTNIAETVPNLQNIMVFLLFMYALFVSSLLYYIYLPWKKRFY